MDDSLSIYLNDYLTNTIISEKLPLQKEELISLIKSSEKFMYEEGTNQIKLKYRPKRKIIVFRDIIKEDQKKELIKEIISLAKEKESEKYLNQLNKIEESNGLFLAHFENEESALEIFKEIESKKEKSYVSLLY